jgi:succinate-acetate transporter protein
VPVEGKAMMTATTSAAGKTLLTVENVQEAVVKALATHAQAAAAFAGMHEFERGNEFGLGEHTAFGAITEGATADEASPGGVGTEKKSDNRPRRGPSRLVQILNWIEWIIVTVGILSIFVFIIALWGEIMGEIGKEAVATLKNVAWTAFTYALACGSMVKAILVIFVVGL